MRLPRPRARRISPSKYVHIREAYVIDITNDIPSTPDAIGVNSATRSGHRECYMQITLTMPGAEDHIIVQSQDEIYMMIDYFTNVTLANSDEILRLQSRLMITLLPSLDGNRQSIRWRSRRRSNKFSKRGRLPCQTSRVLPTSQKPTGRQSTQTRTKKSTEKSTCKSAKSTKILLKPPIESATMKSTGWSPMRTSNDESIPSTDDYRLRDILSRACGSTAQSSDSASALELCKYNHFRETYVRCLRMGLHAIDVYDR